MNKNNVFDGMRNKLENPTCRTANEEYVAKLHSEIRQLVAQLDEKDKKILEMQEKVADYGKFIKCVRQQQFLTAFEDWMEYGSEEDGDEE